MPSTKPVALYVKARDLLQQGARAESLASLSQAMGAEAPLPRLQASLEKALDPGSVLGDLVLSIVVSETRKRR